MAVPLHCASSIRRRKRTKSRFPPALVASEVIRPAKLDAGRTFESGQGFSRSPTHTAASRRDYSCTALQATRMIATAADNDGIAREEMDLFTLPGFNAA